MSRKVAHRAAVLDDEDAAGLLDDVEPARLAARRREVDGRREPVDDLDEAQPARLLFARPRSAGQRQQRDQPDDHGISPRTRYKVAEATVSL